MRLMGLLLRDYELRDPSAILTPALLVYPEFVDANIETTLRVMGGDANRWRPHLKTAKMPWVVRRLLDRGVNHFKCATTRELAVILESGGPDVLIAYPMVGANARRVVAIARQHPRARISVLVENAAQAAFWKEAPVNVFLDVNPGMDRTGIVEDAVDVVVGLARTTGDQFRGIHYYDGHVSSPDPLARQKQAFQGYAHLLKLVHAVESAGVSVTEVITSGTPAFPSAVTYSGFVGRSFTHRASPGTVLFGDVTSLGQLPPELGYRAAALVIATVVSHPLARRVTCNAGHKSVSADAGVPTCTVVGRPDLLPLKPSEEHLPIDVPPGATVPEIDDALYLLPRHICPSVNQFDEALLVRHGRVSGVEPISARGHDPALILESTGLVG